MTTSSTCLPTHAAIRQDYWEAHWQQANGHAPGREIVAHPYLAHEISSLAPGTALDAGCGEGAEAIWLADEGWQVTAADISNVALSRAAERAAKVCATPERVQWVSWTMSSCAPPDASGLRLRADASPERVVAFGAIQAAA